MAFVAIQCACAVETECVLTCVAVLLRAGVLEAQGHLLRPRQCPQLPPLHHWPQVQSSHIMTILLLSLLN